MASADACSDSTVAKSPWETADYSRLENYLLCGKDNYEADRELGAKLEVAFPQIRQSLWHARDFRIAASTHFAQRGISQFLEIGAGLPLEPDPHDRVLQVNKQARVLYVADNPTEATHRRALTASRQAHVLEADFTMASDVIRMASDSREWDFTAPVVVSFGRALERVEDAATLVRAYSDAIVPGSGLVISHHVTDVDAPIAEALASAFTAFGLKFYPRTISDIHALFDGYDLLDPGIVEPARWHSQETYSPELHCRTGIGWRIPDRGSVEPDGQLLN